MSELINAIKARLAGANMSDPQNKPTKRGRPKTGAAARGADRSQVQMGAKQLAVVLSEIAIRAIFDSSDVSISFDMGWLPG
ncbi:hypothetical protein J6500_09385 [Bradyrhizobium sp. WSM 1704]|uniref:hypothetical protein n=1 Tax=Bradyrhizobium semiaridum TaxID=2821404 RepID=UPI001CE2830E|nr:hypothetical protein [Bradyrhizobium semiaridum]MCA6122104.1 hypothetical protein [Bradyrhizobium semiaridum]